MNRRRRLNLATAAVFALTASVGGHTAAEATSSDDVNIAYVVSSQGPLGPSAVTSIALPSLASKRSMPVLDDAVADALTPDGRTLFVASVVSPVRASTDGTGFVTPVDLAQGSAGHRINLRGTPIAIAVARNGLRAYVLDTGVFGAFGGVASGMLTSIDVATKSITKTIKVGSNVRAFVLTSNSDAAYVIGDPLEGSDSYSIVTKIDLRSMVVGPSVKVFQGSENVALSPDGVHIYAVSSGSNCPYAGCHVWGAMTEIDASTMRVDRTLRLPQGVGDPTIAPNGERMYLVSGHGELVAIDMRKFVGLRPIPVPSTSDAIVINDNGSAGFVIGAVVSYPLQRPADGAPYFLPPTGVIVPFDPVTGVVGRSIALPAPADALSFVENGSRPVLVVSGMRGSSTPNQFASAIDGGKVTNRVFPAASGLPIAVIAPPGS